MSNNNKAKPIAKVDKIDKGPNKKDDLYYNDPLNKQRLLVNNDSEFAEEYKRIKDQKAEKLQLSEEEEISERQDNVVILPKKLPMDYFECIISAKYTSKWTKEEKDVSEAVNKEVGKLLFDYKDLILNDVEKISPQQKDVDDIVKANNQSFISVDERLNKEILKELQENHKQLKQKQIALEEEHKLLSKQENIAKLNTSITKNSINTTSNNLALLAENLNSKELIDHNIRVARMNEIKKVKEHLNQKINAVEGQVKRIIDEEQAFDFDKREAIKVYIENFEKEVAKSEEEVKARNEEYRRRAAAVKEKEKQVKEFPLKRKEEEMKKMIQEKEDLVMKGKNFFERRKNELKSKMDKYDNIVKEGSSEKMNLRNTYKFAEIEKREKRNKLEEQTKLKEKLIKQQLEKKSYLKPVTREELNEFAKKVSDNREKILYEKEKARLVKLEELITVNATLPKAESMAYQRVLAEKHEIKEKQEKEKLDKIYKNMKIQNFSKLIHEKIYPKPDLTKQKEIEERINKLNNKRPKRYHKSSNRKTARYKLVKGKGSKSRSPSKNNSLHAVSEMHRSKSDSRLRQASGVKKPVKILKPLLKMPDYLSEIRNKKTKNELNSKFLSYYTFIFLIDEEDLNTDNWDKMMKDNKHTYIQNVERVMEKANKLDEKIKMKEKVLRYAQSSGKVAEETQKLSEIKLEAIKAKLAILDGLNMTS